MALLPLALVIISTILSCLYKISIQSRLTNVWKHKVTTAHAVAIEGIQLFVLLSGIFVQYFQLTAFLRDEIFICYGFLVPPCIAVPVTLAIYVLSIFTIDLIDNKIQLGAWKHPLQVQTLLLTRSWLLPWTVKRRRWHHRATSRPADFRQPKEDTKSPISAIFPTSLHLARRCRSLSEPTIPRTPLSDLLLQRRGSLPVPGSVARLVSTFEKDFASLSQSIEISDCGSMTTWPGSIGGSERSSSFSTPSSISEQVSLGFDDPFDMKTTDLIDQPDVNAIATMPAIEDILQSDISTGLPTPDTTPEKPSISPCLSATPHPPEQTTKSQPERSKKAVARHIAERAQRRKQKSHHHD